MAETIHPMPNDADNKHTQVQGTPDFANTQVQVGAPTVHSPQAGGLPAIPGHDVLDILGRGGMGIVYRGIQLGLNRTVAIKTILRIEASDSLSLLRFFAEAEVVAAVKHPHVVQVYDFGSHGGRPYMTMEYLPGGTLAKRIAGQKPMDPHAAATLVEQLARGAGAAHELGIVHRDLKPANVLFDDAGNPKITDFGLAKRVATDLTQTNAIIGTPAYMAPEQAGGLAKFLGPPADVWALGVILYECLSGKRPFEGDDSWTVLRNVVESTPAALRTRTGRMPRDLELICLKCLRKEPSERYANATALAGDLHHFLHGEPVLARPISGPERLWKWMRRNPTFAALAAGLIVVLLTGSIVSTLFAIRASEEAVRANAALREAQDERQKTQEALIVVEAEREKVKAALIASSNAKSRTRDALDALTDTVVERMLAKQAKPTDSDRQFLKKILAFYDEAAAAEDDDFRVWRLKAVGRYQVGKIRAWLGDQTEAEANFRESVAIYTKLLPGTNAQQRPEIQKYLAQSTYQLGTLLSEVQKHTEAIDVLTACKKQFHDLFELDPKNVYAEYMISSAANDLGLAYWSVGKNREAEVEFQQSIDLRAKLAKAYPNDPSYAGDLAGTVNNLGLIYGDEGKFSQAESQYLMAIKIITIILQKDKQSILFRAYLGKIHQNLAEVRSTLKKPEAGTSFLASIDVRRSLYADYPAVPEYGHALADCHNDYGLYLKNLAKPAEALVQYRAAKATWLKLAADFPGDPRYPNGIAGAMVNMAFASIANLDAGAAKPFLEDALPYHRTALKAQPDNSQFRSYYWQNRSAMAAVLISKKDYAAAAALAEDIAAYGSEAKYGSLNAAKLLGECSELASEDERKPEAERKRLANLYADNAMKQLQNAVKAGYNDAKSLRKAIELKALRDRPDFRILIEKLAPAVP